MDQEIKLGIIYFIIALSVPLMILPFVSGYSKDKGFFENLYEIAIPIREEQPNNPDAQPADNLEKPKSKTTLFLKMITPKRIPFRFFLVITLIFLYMGVIRIDSARRRLKEPYNGPIIG
jgi:hypothetical protein